MKLFIDNLGKVAVTVEEDYWSNDKDYDKLTIVEKEEIFGTFISRKPVPAGTPLTDRKYWIPFSSLKEEIVLHFNELVNELKDLEVSVDEKEAEIYKAMASISAGGIALKQSFGNSEVFGISQKVLTESRNNLQAQIDEIVSGGATVNLTATPSPVFVGVSSTINLSATTDTNASSIKITKGDNEIANGSGLSLIGNDSLKVGTSGTVAYKATFTINGINKSVTRSVSVVDKIYYGAGSAVTNTPGPKTSPAGTYNVNVAADATYVWFYVPAIMTINKATLSGFDFPLDAPQNMGIDGVTYKAYRSSNTLDAGTYQIVIS